MAHKRKHHSMHHGKKHHAKHHGRPMSHVHHSRDGGSGEMSVGMHKPRHVEMANNRGRGLISEDWSRPCGIPYGAISKDINYGYHSATDPYHVGDLFEQVDKNMREDTMAMREQIVPHNW